ncbi:MAG: hypothetical protein IT337_08565 [Thermomicrobiales bacterium]|nr:hypothetical protein [Thermomicrobiales bacterium]
MDDGSTRSGHEESARIARGGPAERRDRHILLGVSHPSGDPALHRTFEIRAAYDAAAGGWAAQIGEQNQNEQPAAWRGSGSATEPRAYPSPAVCLGAAVAMLVAAVDRDAAESS